MTVQFDISELEKLVEPDNLLDVLDTLFDEGKILQYQYDWENGYCFIEISEKTVIEDIFKESQRGKVIQ